MTTIMNIDEAFPRGKHMGTQSDGPPMREADRRERCSLCGGFVAILDLAWVEDHEVRCRTRRAMDQTRMDARVRPANGAAC
jgi:hypothetical protein